MARRKKTPPATEPAAMPEKEPVKAVAEKTRPPPEGNSQDQNGSFVERERFRSWVTDRQHGYERMTDEKRRKLVVKFAQPPSAEVLEKLKDGGFHYQPQWYDQQKVWTRFNDFEGRARLDEIESLVRGSGRDGPERNG